MSRKKTFHKWASTMPKCSDRSLSIIIIYIIKDKIKTALQVFNTSWVVS